MATSVPDWLDSVKAGYGNKFALCFEDIGVEDVADVPDIHINNKALMELEESLRKAGAKTIHVAKITAAIAELAGKGSGGMAPTRPAIPASSSRSPHHAVKNTAAPDKQYACFLSHHKAACAMEARFLKEKLEALMNKEVFLDSDDLKVRLVALHSAQPNVFLTRLSSCFARPPAGFEKAARPCSGLECAGDPAVGRGASPSVVPAGDARGHRGGHSHHRCCGERSRV
jgi:hypothetical protein